MTKIVDQYSETRMNKKIKAKWLEALRSGDYKQGKGQLRNEKNNFCCLGVLCNLHAEAKPKFAAKQEFPGEYGGDDALPPDVVVGWAGLSENNPCFEMPFNVRGTGKDFKGDRRTFKKGDLVDIAHLNDSGLGFKQIADVIEAVM